MFFCSGFTTGVEGWSRYASSVFWAEFYKVFQLSEHWTTLSFELIWRRHPVCHPAPPLLLTACTNTFVPSLCETEGWHFANFITSSLSSWQLLQPGSKFPQLATCHWHRRYLAFKPISASVCFFSTRRRSILSSLAGGLECHWVFLALNSINTILFRK